MPSILLSFVGQQDPVSDNTREDGSIVSLLRHLTTEHSSIKQVILLYTSGPNGTQDRAELTQDWLADEPFSLPKDTIELIPVRDGLSEDPVDLWLAVQSARQGLDIALAVATTQDTLEFNASSGTPVMKSAWSILQAAGYAPKSRLWQVRNPKEQRPGQARVFQTNIQALRQEFDLNIIQQQLRDYNYSGALTTLNASGLATPTLVALLRYGHCRLCLDFGQAKAAIIPVAKDIAPEWMQDILALSQSNPSMLLREAYVNAVIELKNQKFSDFLVRVSQFQEKALELLVNQPLAGQPQLPQSYQDTSAFWSDLAANHPDLYHFLQNYTFKGTRLRLEGFPNRPTLLACLEFGQSPILEPLKALNSFCEQRNTYIHKFVGISTLPDTSRILAAMRQVLVYVGQVNPGDNPFNRLNQAILQQLRPALG